MIEIKNYTDMSHITVEDILDYMKTKSPEEIEEFKNYCKTPTVVRYANGTEKTRTPVFFEIRRWIVDKYFPNALRSNKTGGKKQATLLDRIMEL